MFRVIAAATTASVLTLALVAGGGAAAHAADDPTPTEQSSLSAIQRAGALQSDRRITALENAANRLEHSEYVGDDTRERLSAILDDGLGDIAEAQQQIAEATTASEAWDAYRAMFTDHRIYAVVLPQVYGAAAADRLEGTTVPRLQAAHDRLADALAGEHSDDATPELQQKLDELQGLLDDAAFALDGLADRALAVTPADFDADHTVLTSIRAELRDVGATLREAAALAGEILDALR